MANKKSILETICLAVVVGIFLYPDFVLAESISKSDSVFGQAYETMRVTFQNARNIVYVLSGFGLIGVSIGAIMGKLDFKWLAMICVGLAVLAGADSVVNYAIKDVETDRSYVGVGQEEFELNLQFSDY